MMTNPASAQTGPPEQPNPPTNLSDVSGPFLDNFVIPRSPLVTSYPKFQVSVLDKVTVVLISEVNQPESNGLGTVLNATVQLSSTMDGLLPFAGCSNVNWRSYNAAVRDAKDLKKALAEAVADYKKTLVANPTPEQKKAWEHRLTLIEKTTAALDAATKTLVYLGDAMDKSR